MLKPSHRTPLVLSQRAPERVVDLGRSLRVLRIEAAVHFGFGFLLVGWLAIELGGLWTLPLSYPLQSAGIFALIALACFLILPTHLPQRRFGPANQVTLVRAGMIALLAGLIGIPVEQLAAHAWMICAAAFAAALLDGLDGWVARRSGSASRFGARFDMELDGLLILVLSILAWQMGKAGVWILAAGALRYLFVVAQYVWPVLTRPLPPSRRRQAVCALQTLALVLALVPLIPTVASTAIAAVGLALLFGSFAIDTFWLVTSRKQTGG